MPASLTSIALLLAGPSALLIIWRHWKERSSGVRSLPGPPGRFLVGNLFDVPPRDSHLKYTDWSKLYGPIFEINVFNRTVVVISAHSVAMDLLEKRGSIYSDRPALYMHDLAGWGWNAAHMHHNDEWRVRRRLVHQTFQANKVPRFYDMIRRTTLEYARGLLATPDNFLHHIRRSAAANTLKAVYGIDVALEHDVYVDIAENAMDSLNQVMMPGMNIVDWLPFLRRLPEWVPGMGFHRRARELRRHPDAMLNVAYARFKDDLASGVAPVCMMSLGLENLDPANGMDERAVKEAGAVAYLGGSDTSVASLTSFVRAMVIWPEYQKKAQTELDRIVGRDRLPDFADLAALPYVEAIIRETYRKYPVTPLGVPHAVEKDDVYLGMLIKKGATVLANEWAILRDEALYPDAETFNPERFLHDGQIRNDVPDPRFSFFGYGRRICPGRHFADASVFLMAATTLHCFNISKHTKNGRDVTPTEELVTGLVSSPPAFKCTIKPRFSSASTLINEAYEVREPE